MLQGLVAPLLTPVHENGAPDINAMRRLVRHVIAGGADALFVFGSSGLYSFFTPEQKYETVKAVVETAVRRVPVVAGVTASGLEMLRLNVEAVRSAGADAVVIAGPDTFAMRSEGDLKYHFLKALDIAACPAYIYHNPTVSLNTLNLDLVLELAAAGYRGIKDSSRDMEFFRQLLWAFQERDGTDFAILQGCISLCDISLILGASGIVPGTACLAPGEYARLVREARSNDLDGCWKTQYRLSQLSGIYGPKNVDWPGAAYYVLYRMGICKNCVPSPFHMVSAERAGQIDHLLEKLGLPGSPSRRKEGGYSDGM